MSFLKDEMPDKMAQIKFVFDLDCTVTKEELLPKIARYIGKEEEMSALTIKAMTAAEDFEVSFTKRVDMLKNVPLLYARQEAENIDVFEDVIEFLLLHKDKCLIVTGNLDVWIEPLIKRLGICDRYVCSTAKIENEKICGIKKICDKTSVVEKLQAENYYVVAIGDGTNDIGMLKTADIGIAFEGAHDVPQCVKNAADLTFDSAKAMCEFLSRLDSASSS